MKLSILSISLLTVMASAAISPALAKISQAFPAADRTLIKLVLTLPSLLIVIFSLLCGWLASRTKKKYILLTGLVIYFFAGAGSAFARTVPELLLIRGLFGIGAGLLIPFSTGLIADFFVKEERTKMIGLSGSVSHLGGVIFLLLSGWLACISWRYAFAVYGLSGPIFLMVLFWLPEPVYKKAAGPQKVKLPAEVYICALLGGLMMVAFYAAPTNLAMFIESEIKIYTSQTPLLGTKAELQRSLVPGVVSSAFQDAFFKSGIQLSDKAVLAVEEIGKKWTIVEGNKKYIMKKEKDGMVVYTERLGRPGIAGYYLSIMALVGVFSGIVLAVLMRWFGTFIPAVGIGSMAAGYALLGTTSSLSGALVAMVCIGFSSGVLIPLLLLHAAKTVAETSCAFAMAVLSVGLYFGQFISPVILKWLGSLIGSGDMFRQQFHVLALGLGIAACVGVMVGFKNAKQAKIPRIVS
jgi:MFS family permease